MVQSSDDDDEAGLQIPAEQPLRLKLPSRALPSVDESNPDFDQDGSIPDEHPYDQELEDEGEIEEEEEEGM